MKPRLQRRREGAGRRAPGLLDQCFVQKFENDMYDKIGNTSSSFTSFPLGPDRVCPSLKTDSWPVPGPNHVCSIIPRV
jgi:hypothetical protein